MKKLSVLFLVPLLVFVSGCTLFPITISSNGVEIESFAADFSTVYEGESVMFRMYIRNTGSDDSPEVFAEVLGIDQEWGPNPGAEKFPNEEECRYDKSHFSLLAPDPSSGVPGQAHLCTWTYTAPDLPSGQSIKYDVTGRVFYRYSSATITTVTFGSYDEIRELQDSGQAPPAETTSYSEGPIKISIEAQGPIRFSENDNSVDFPLQITLENIGGGAVCNAENPNQCKMYTGGAQYRDKIDVSLSANDITFEDCDAEGLTLWPGSSNSYTCEATATSLPPTISQRTITATSEYSYYSDKVVSVTVIGK